MSATKAPIPTNELHLWKFLFLFCFYFSVCFESGFLATES